MMPAHPTPRSGALAGRLLAALAVAVVAAWLWRNLCLFPAHGWNEVRLAPAFAWWYGGTPYPSPAGGPATTWMYGPLPLLAVMPAVLASTAAGALTIAGLMNIAILAAAVWLAVARWPGSAPAAGAAPRTLAAIAAIALWPGEAFRYFTADNTGIACGLISLVCLARASRPADRWLAAAACAGAILCKQTFVALAVAQLVWLGWRQGWAEARRHASQVALCLVIPAAGFAACWGVEAPVFQLFTLPMHQPWVPDVTERLRAFGPALTVQLGLPAALLALLGRNALRRGSPWLLPVLAWAFSSPLDVAALLKQGGAANSLHGGLLLLPAAVALLADRLGPARRNVLLAALALAAAGTGLARIAPDTWQPRTEHLRQGEALARQLPGEIYFPWHPLVPWFAEHRLDDVEDGWFIRAAAGRPVTPGAMRLPPRFHGIAFRREEMDWGMARSLIPRGAQVDQFGLWEVHSWRAPR
jgi:hypothetical protein